MIWPQSTDQIIDLILLHEGGFVNIAADIGLATNFGISTDTLASWRKKTVTVADVQNLKLAEARQIYETKYIVGPNFDQLSDIRLRTAMVDFGVLFGPLRAIQALQLILETTIDGVLGPKTLALANLKDARPIINQLSVVRVNKHTDRVIADNSQLTFFRGWISRAMSFVE